MTWRFADVEPLLDRWIEVDAPGWEERMRTISWLLAVREEPRRLGCSPVPGSDVDLWLTDTPGTNVSFLYVIEEVDEDDGVLVGQLLETL